MNIQAYKQTTVTLGQAEQNSGSLEKKTASTTSAPQHDQFLRAEDRGEGFLDKAKGFCRSIIQDIQLNVKTNGLMKTAGYAALNGSLALITGKVAGACVTCFVGGPIGAGISAGLTVGLGVYGLVQGAARH